MSKISATSTNWTATAVADATNQTDAQHHTIQGGSSTQMSRIIDVVVGGLASSSAPQILALARNSTVGATLSGGRQAALHPSVAALSAPPVSFTTSTTKPQRSSTLWLLSLSFNAYGGQIRWIAAPDEEASLLGNTASLGEVGLSAFTGSTAGAISDTIIFEPL